MQRISDADWNSVIMLMDYGNPQSNDEVKNAQRMHGNHAALEDFRKHCTVIVEMLHKVADRIGCTIGRCDKQMQDENKIRLQ